MSTQTPQRPKIGRRTLVIAVAVVAVLLVAAIAGTEAYARHQVSRCISSSFEQQMGSSIDVGFGPKPMLLTYLDGKVGSVTIDSEDNKFGPAVGMVVHAEFEDIELDKNNGGGTIGSSQAEVTWDNDGIRQTLGGMVSGVSSSARDKTITLDVLGGLAQLQVVPSVRDGNVTVETKSAQLLGIGLPTDLVQGIVETFTQSLQSYPLGLRAKDLQVTDDGIIVHLEGGRTTLESTSNGTDQAQFTC
ncbi:MULTISPECIES: LmeA family phospholipid-binding protein [unclassified Nocardia]|uniref:LmeA family phospholipid-binding protein n=1 Tax=Nocardia sp. NPDC056064 TaxID=3345701 RepID=UPI0035DB20E7